MMFDVYKQLKALVFVQLIVLSCGQTWVWKDGRATYYGHNSHIHSGSCGYGYICQDEGTGWDVAAISNKHWDYENSCGRCYEVKCRSGTFTDGFGEQIQRENVCRNESSSVLVRVVDTCPCTGENYSNTRWCCGDMEHLGLSVWAFEKLSDIKYGVIGIEYRQVACDYVLDSAALPVKAPFKPEYEDLKNDCQKAQTYQNKNVVANSLNITHTSLPNQQLYQQNEDELWSLLFNTNFQVHQEDLKQSEVVISTRNSALVQNQTIFNSSTDQQDWWVTSSKASIEQRKGLGQQGGTIICSSIQPGGNLAFTGVPGALYGQKFLELWLKELEDDSTVPDLDINIGSKGGMCTPIRLQDLAPSQYNVGFAQLQVQMGLFDVPRSKEEGVNFRGCRGSLASTMNTIQFSNSRLMTQSVCLDLIRLTLGIT
eukprot:TRINITY_DN2398_c0_g1_i3.p1 TRINITY_DN2398_c0_g1~~TRINITY_DN2398_c0_g1_i3.p1  ORF type:complete len:426 (-),score=35.94 TRINITY_DN2398_c0_g1_i3:255-1532(-)